MTKQQQAEEQKQYAIEQLKKYCPPGTRILIQFLYVNHAGTERRHSFFVAHEGEVICLNGYLADGFGYKIRTGSDTPTGISTGFDNGEKLVDTLSYALYEDSHQLTSYRLQ